MPDKTALITGAGSGLGMGIAWILVKAGYDLGLHTGTNEERARRLAEELRKESGRKVEVFVSDFSVPTGAEKLFERFRKSFDSLDLFVNNAGVTIGERILKVTQELWDTINNIDWRNAFFCVKEAAQFMVEKRNRGSIVIISSNQHNSIGGNVLYSLVKDSLVKYTAHAAMQFARYGIRVNCIAPGWVDYCEYARKCGADAVIAMPPAEVSFDYIRKYFRKISDAAGIPVMIQNHSMAGTMLSPEQLIRLCEEIENVGWVKQEVKPGPVSISALMAVKTSALIGIMSGYGSQYAPLDYERGAIASIHACEWADLVQQTWDLFSTGKEEEGRRMHYAILPALQLEGLLGMRYAKEVMIRRGVFNNRIMRRAANELSSDDMKEIDKIFELVKPYMKDIRF